MAIRSGFPFGLFEHGRPIRDDVENAGGEGSIVVNKVKEGTTTIEEALANVPPDLVR